MIATARPPTPALSDTIALLWYQEHYVPNHTLESVLPDGSVELIINLGDVEIPIPVFHHAGFSSFETTLTGVVLGPRSKPAIIATDRAITILGVHFKPGRATRLLDLPAEELRNQILPLEALWGDLSEQLRDRLRECHSVEARFELLEQFLLARLGKSARHDLEISFAVATLEHHRGTRAVSALSASLGWSSNRLLRTFREAVGLTPAMYRRVCRFQQAVHWLEIGGCDLAFVALECGYTDQAHLTNDFRDLSGITPSVYLARRGPRAGHPKMSL